MPSTVSLPLRAFRAFLDDVVLYRGTPPDLEREIEEHARRQTVRLGRPLVLLGAAIAVAWWPTDLLFYGDRPDVWRAFAGLRVFVVLLSFAYFLTAQRFAFARRHFAAWATLLSMLLVGECAWFAGSVGNADSPWFALFTFAPLIPFTVLMRLGERVAATLLITGSAFGGYFLAHPANLAGPHVANALGTLLFAVVVGLSTGHALYHTTRGSFLQARALEELTSTLCARVEARTAELRLLARHVEELRENERGAIARELHDELGQILTGMRVELDLAESRRLRGADLAAQHAKISELLDATLAATRTLLSRLRPRLLDDFGLVAALEWLVSDTRRRSGLELSFVAEPAELETSGEVATAVFRIVQESLTNVLRHAAATTVRVELRLGREALELTVADDGRGLPAPADRRPASMGLVGMRERAAALGGTLEFGANGPRGTVVSVRLPAPAATKREAA